MRPDLMEILCCPMCKGDLKLAVTEQKDQEILGGNLTCLNCGTLCPIDDGIPNLLPPDERD